VKFDSHPSYLCICLDRSLLFRTHLHTLKKKPLNESIDVPLNESMRVITGCLRSIPFSFLPILSGITSSETRRSASCLKLYTKALNQKHLLHETLHLKPSPKRLRSRKPLRSFVELLSINGEPTTPIPAALNPSFLHSAHNHQVATSPEMPGSSSTA